MSFHQEFQLIDLKVGLNGENIFETHYIGVADINQQPKAQTGLKTVDQCL